MSYSTKQALIDAVIGLLVVLAASGLCLLLFSGVNYFTGNF